MVKVLLINPGFEIEYVRKNYQLVFPFGLGYIATFSEKHGHEIVIWDIYAEQLGFDKVKNMITNFDFSPYNYIGITGIINQYLYVKELTNLLKKKINQKIILGGPLSSYSWETILKHTDIDICVIGEGEQTFLEILDGKRLPEIDGIAFRENGKIKLNKERELIKNIDEIGIPAFHLFNMKRYIHYSGMQDIIRPYYRNHRIMAMITTRGCPYNCNFCSKSMKGIRAKSLDFIFKEIEYYKNVLKVNAIHFVDELLLINKKRFLEFCNRIKNYNIIWDCQGRINLADNEILLAMKISNGVLIGFGIESGNQNILNNMNKQIKREKIIEILKYCIKINLPVKVQLIYGYPGENRITIYDTISLFKAVNIPARRFAIITPLPGSQLYEVAKTDGFIGDKETDKISEEDYLIFLSKNNGYVSKQLFYNRTKFSDNEFFINLRKLENILFLNFIKKMQFHPFYFFKHWFVYRMYLRDWWHYRKNLYFFNLKELLQKVIINPKKYLKIL